MASQAIAGIGPRQVACAAPHVAERVAERATTPAADSAAASTSGRPGVRWGLRKPQPAAVAAATGFAGDQRPRPLVLLLVVALHAAALALLLTQKMLVAPPPPQPMLVVEVPPPVLPPPPQVAAPELRMEAPAILVPPPLVEIAQPPRPTVAAVVAEPAPLRPPPGPVIAAAPSSGPSAPALETLPATMIEAVPPRYPLEARQRKEQGTVVLEVQLSPAGLVEQIEIHRSSGSPRLDKAALDAVRRWRFVPARQGEQAVDAWVLVPITFTLQG